MSNYQRLISYIYEYEGGNKGRNVGFAKLETRGGQCKVTVSIKKIYVGAECGICICEKRGLRVQGYFKFRQCGGLRHCHEPVLRPFCP